MNDLEVMALNLKMGLAKKGLKKRCGLSTGGSVTMKLSHLVVPVKSFFLADLGKARGCSINTVVNI